MRKPLTLVVMILLVLQTVILAVIAIQRSDSATFRLAVGFLGLGLVITPLVLRTATRLADDDRSVFAEIVHLALLVFMLVSPWIPLLVEHGRNAVRTVNELMIVSSSLNLSAAALGFLVVAIVFTLKPPPDDDGGPVIRTFRILASLLLLWFAAYSLFPVLANLAPWFRENNPFAMTPSSYGGILSASTGDPSVWLLDCALATFAYYRFYAAMFLKRQFG